MSNVQTWSVVKRLLYFLPGVRSKVLGIRKVEEQLPVCMEANNFNARSNFEGHVGVLKSIEKCNFVEYLQKLQGSQREEPSS